MVRKGEGFAKHCPKDCPFRDNIASGQTMVFCSFALFADLLEPGRHTRTEIKDGKIDYHVPPNCDVYEKYKGKKKEIRKMKRSYEQKGLSIRMSRKGDSGLTVTASKHFPKYHHHIDM